jgi:hypothetical protein
VCVRGADTENSWPAIRDPRIDLVRGLALLVIFTDHLSGGIFRLVTPINLGFADMSEVFLFLSGYVCALAYGRVLVERGWFVCQLKAGRRVGQLYAAHFITAGIVCFVLWLAHEQSGADLAGFRDWTASHESVFALLREIAILRYLSGNFEILPLYCLLLLPLPLVLRFARQSGLSVLFASLALYAAVQFFPQSLRLPNHWDRVWLFNPWAWQFPFYLGVAVGLDVKLRRFLFSNRLAVVIVALVFLEAVFLLKVLPHEWDVPFTGKSNCGPLRMVNFWALVVVGRALLPREIGSVARKLLSPLLLCGRNALATYCVGSRPLAA